MNRSILIIICDFLLVSLLVFSTPDLNKLTEAGNAQPLKLEPVSNHTENRQDLAAVMKLALEDERRIHDRLVADLTQTKDLAGKTQLQLAEERRNRDRLQQELTQTQDTVGKQQNLLAERDKLLAERQRLLAEGARQIQAYQQSLQLKEEQARQLQQAKSELEQQMAATQSNLQNLRQQLQATAADALISKEKVAAAEAELRKQQGLLQQLEATNQVVQAERQQLTTKLQVAETEKRSVTEQLAKTVEDVKVERAEKARLTEHADKLADGVKTLASKSGELAAELREHRPLAANTIFSEFLTNRVHARFSAHRAGLFGIELSKRKETETVLVSDGTNCFALCHVEDTGLTFGYPGTDWESLTGNLSRSAVFFSIRTMTFHQADPRVALIPVSPVEARDLRCKIYQVASDPFSFQEAVLVGAREGYYGECKFMIDPGAPDYLKMDHSFIRGLFGKFNPSRGDLVFNKTGELLGVMANGTYCVRLTKVIGAGTLRFGDDVRAERTGELLSQFYSRVEQMPFKLQ